MSTNSPCHTFVYCLPEQQAQDDGMVIRLQLKYRPRYQIDAVNLLYRDHATEVNGQGNIRFV